MTLTLRKCSARCLANSMHHTLEVAPTPIPPALEGDSLPRGIFDDTYTGDGLKVSEIIARGPIAIKANAIKAGDIITAIDGTQIKAGEDYFPYWQAKPAKRVRITVAHSDGKSSDYTVKPVDSGANRSLLYKRWVERNQKVTDSISGGKIGYVHIQGMDSPSFRTIYDEVLGRYRNCDAIIVDTRYNGGGWLPNDVALLFNGKNMSTTCPADSISAQTHSHNGPSHRQC